MKFYLVDSFTRIFSMVADWPCDVKSMIMSHKASGNGVNWPCTVGATIQSSMSPAIQSKYHQHKFFRFKSISEIFPHSFWHKDRHTHTPRYTPNHI